MASPLSLFYCLLLLTPCLCQSVQREQTPNTEPSSESAVFYHSENNYTQYCRLFSRKAGQKNTLQLTHLGTGNEVCSGIPCRFYVYLYEPEEVKRTIFISSGLHGNEKIGPTSLLYAYDLLRPNNTRIIYFPVGNPSGYMLNKRQTYPGKIDPNRDYPFDGNVNCYKTSATRIIDYIYRKYPIDLTLNLHNGGDQIGWNWGTVAYKKTPRTPEYSMNLQMGKMMQYYGGYNSYLNIKEFRIGTMTQSVYPASGTLDDWAYAGSWDPSTPPTCLDYKFEPYPKDMHKGLMFLFELGMHNTPEGKLGTSLGLQQSPVAQSVSNGYVTRALRLLSSIVAVLDPQISAVINSSHLYVKIKGCNTLQSSSLSASLRGKSIPFDNVLFDRIGELPESFLHVGVFPLTPQLLSEYSWEVNYNFECDKEWRDKSHTIFGKARVFEGVIGLSPNSIIGDEELKRFLMEKDKLMAYVIGSLILVLVALGLGYAFKRRMQKKVLTKRIQEMIKTEGSEHEYEHNPGGSQGNFSNNIGNRELGNMEHEVAGQVDS